MSPEQINQDPAIDHHTDVFSLGAVLYEVLCGKTPALGEKLHQVIESALNDTPAMPSELAAQSLPPLLEDVAMRCLQKNPADRYDTMAEMIRVLQQDRRHGHKITGD